MGLILTLMPALFYSTVIGAATEPMRPLRSSRTTKRTVYSPSGCGEGFYFAGKGASETPSLGRLTSFLGCLLLWYYTVCNVPPPGKLGRYRMESIRWSVLVLVGYPPMGRY